MFSKARYQSKFGRDRFRHFDVWIQTDKQTPRQAKMLNVLFPQFLENPQAKTGKSSKLFSFDIMMYD